MSHACHRFWKCYKNPHVFTHFWQRAQSLAPATQDDIWTSKSAPIPSVFYTFDFEMCFAPQRRALFRHLNFQKWSEPGVLCTFWFRNVLRATTACTFSTSQLRKVLRTWGVFSFSLANVLRVTTACAFRQRNFKKCSEPVNFLHFWLGNVLRAATACNFSSLIWPAGSAPAALASLFFDPPEPQIIEKTQCFATFLPFRAPGSSFFWDFLFFDLLPSFLLFSDSSRLCFSSVHIVASLTSKLPSIIHVQISSSCCCAGEIIPRSAWSQRIPQISFQGCALYTVTIRSRHVIMLDIQWYPWYASIASTSSSSGYHHKQP